MLKKSLMAVSLAAMVFMALGCSETSENDPASLGNAKLAVVMGDDYEVTSVHWAIADAAGAMVREGDIAVDDPSATISTFISGLPAGTGYTMTLSADLLKDGAVVGSCGQTATFDVIAGELTMLSMTLNCKLDETEGDVALNADANMCPSIDYVTAAPLVQVVGEPVALAAEASDADGDAITSAWSAASGTFAAADALSTTFTCTLGTMDGIDVVLSLNVTDNVMAADDEIMCDAQKEITVICKSAAVCGNGVVEPGEACDDGNTVSEDGCSGDCLLVEECGDGVVQAGLGEECDPPNGTSCNDQCLLMGCGNGILEPGEGCDDGNRDNCDGCDANCNVEVCGNGVLDCNEECDDGNLVDGDGCESDCTITPDVCLDCELANCTNYKGVDVYDACHNGPTGALCTAVMDCAHASDCALKDASGNLWPAPHPNKCYCGTADVMGCMTGGANGVCKAEVEAASETTDPMVIGERFANPAYAIGDAMNLLLCDLEFCGDGICL